MKFSRFIVVWCLVFTMLSGYIIILTPSYQAIGTHDETVIDIRDTFDEGLNSSWSGGISRSTTLAYNGSASGLISASPGAGISFSRNLSYVFDSDLHGIYNISLDLYVDQFSGSSSYNDPFLYFSTISTDGIGIGIRGDGMIGMYIGLGGSLLKTSLSADTWHHIQVIANFTGTGGPVAFSMIFNGVTYTENCAGGHSIEPIKMKGYASSNSIIYIDNLIVSHVIHGVPDIPPVENNVTIPNDFSLSSFIDLIIPFLIVLLPAALIGVYVGRFGFIITLSLMMTLYLIIDPIVLPTAIVVWTQTAIMFYRGG